MRAGAGAVLATAAVVAVAVLAWPGAETVRDAPRPAAEVDLPQGAISIPVGDGPSEVAVGDGVLWVSSSSEETVSRIDPVTNQVSFTIPVSGGPGDLAVGDGGEVWAATVGAGSVQRIDPVTNTTTPDRRIDVAPAEVSLDLAIDEFLWVSVVERELVQVDPATGDVVRRIDWVRPVNVAARDGWVLALDASGIVRAVDAETGEPAGFELAFDVHGRGDVHFDDGRVWVAQGDGSTLYSASVEGEEEGEGEGEIESYSFRGTYIEMVHTLAGIVVLSDLGDETGVLTLIDPDTGETTEFASIEGEPRDLVRGLDDLWVSAFGADALIRIPSLP